MIEFHILNLKKDLNRKLILLGNLIGQFVPVNQIHFHEAIYGHDYASIEEIHNDAETDGYPEFRHWGEPHQSKSEIAMHWGYMKILDHIISDAFTAKFACVSQDDILLNAKYIVFETIADYLYEIDEDFVLWQPYWIGDPVTIDPKNLLQYDKLNITLHKGAFPSGDSLLVMTKQGASLMREYFREHQLWFEQIPANLSGGVYASLDPYDFSFPMNRVEGIEEYITVSNFSSTETTFNRSSDNFKELLIDTDSSKQHTHNYGDFYESTIKALRALNGGQPINVLEIGVVGAGLLRTSEKAFHESPDVARYVGIDSMPLLHSFFGENSHFIEGDAYSADILEQVRPFGEFHLIIDDGSHDWQHQIAFFDIYRHIRAPKSVMVCEDVMTFWVGVVLSRIRQEFGLENNYHIATNLYPEDPEQLLLSNLVVNYQI